MTQYAVITRTTSKYDDETNKYLTVKELNKLIEAGDETIEAYDTFSQVFDTLEDAKAVSRADDIRFASSRFNRNTQIVKRRIVKIEDVTE